MPGNFVDLKLHWDQHPGKYKWNAPGSVKWNFKWSESFAFFQRLIFKMFAYISQNM